MLKVNVGMWNQNDYQTHTIDDERQTRMLNDDGVEKTITMDLFVCVEVSFLFPIDLAQKTKSQCVNMAPK